MEARGVVKEVIVKEWNSKKLYSFKLNGDSNFYGLGLRKPPNEGTNIRFNYNVNDKGYKDVVFNSIETLAATDTPKTVEESVRLAKPMNKDEYWDNKAKQDVDKDRRISLLACRNSAIELCNLLLVHGIVSLPAKQAAKEAVVLEMVRKYTKDFISESEGTSVEKQEESVEEAVTEVESEIVQQDEKWV